MDETTQANLILLGAIVGGLMLLTLVLHLLPRFGAVGRAAARFCTRAPGLDLVITAYTAAPWVIGLWLQGWRGGLVGVLAQAITLIVWARLHEAVSPKRPDSQRISRTLNQIVGTARNHLAVWWTALAVPIFLFIRIGELVIYPPLTWLIRLPKYKTGEWINVSRQKFDGLVGYDLAWCLYCDWMTGVWSLGSEMLRNVESFWCPIRFLDPSKCENCKTDFPDVSAGWVPSDGTMEDVTAVLREKYPGPGGDNPWFNHPVRLTVERREVGGRD